MVSNLEHLLLLQHHINVDCDHFVKVMYKTLTPTQQRKYKIPNVLCPIIPRHWHADTAPCVTLRIYNDLIFWSNHKRRASAYYGLWLIVSWQADQTTTDLSLSVFRILGGHHCTVAQISRFCLVSLCSTRAAAPTFPHKTLYRFARGSNHLPFLPYLFFTS